MRLRRPVTNDGAERLNRSAKIDPERSFMRRTRAMEEHREVQRTDAEWKQALTRQQYEVLRRAATEPPFTGEYVLNKADGTYRCAACGATLFDSATKFESGTGWPSFTEPADVGAVDHCPHNKLFNWGTAGVLRASTVQPRHGFANRPLTNGL